MIVNKEVQITDPILVINNLLPMIRILPGKQADQKAVEKNSQKEQAVKM